MKKTGIIIIGFAILAAALYIGITLLPGQNANAEPQSAEGKQLYTCGMHPQVITTEPGYCPICGMRLVPKKEGASQTIGSIAVDAATRQNMGVKTSTVSYNNLIRKIRAYGRIDYSQPKLHSINVKIDGWVEKLYVNYEGAEVQSGQPLLELYSPMLVAAQKEYLAALKNVNSSGSSETGEPNEGALALLRDATTRLKNWDISDKQIQRLKEEGEIIRTMTIESPYRGVITMKDVVEGNQLMPGMKIFEIADISSVWAVATVYEQDLQYIEEGQNALITLPYISGEILNGTVSFISPTLNEMRQAEVRIDISNISGFLKPGMYAEINIESALPGQRLTVPLSAVINSGTKQVVYVAHPDDSYEPRVILTGAQGDDDLIEIKSGLAENEEIVISGQFMLDSESRLNEALTHSGHDGIPAGGGGSKESEPTSHQESDLREMDEPSEEHQEQHGGHSMDAMKDSSENKSASKTEHESHLSGIFTCPMDSHADILQYGPGKCSKCGMKLVPVEETKGREMFVCPMSEDSMVSSKAGECSKCGMKLQKMSLKVKDDKKHSDENEKTKEIELSGIYTCPMDSHADVLQFGPGKCSKCGMKLVEIEKTENRTVLYCPMTEDSVATNKAGKCPKCGMKLVKFNMSE